MFACPARRQTARPQTCDACCIPTPAPRTPRLPRDIRRRELLDATLDLIYEQGPSAVSVEAVARRAGVTRPVVYDHFGDLGGLLAALIDREERAALAPLVEVMSAPGAASDPEQLLTDGVTAFLDAVRANPRTWRLVLMTPLGNSEDLRDRFAAGRRTTAERLTALIDWALAARGGPTGLDHPLLARIIVAGGEDAARLTLVHPDRYPPRRIARMAGAWFRLLPTQPAPTAMPAQPAYTVPAAPPQTTVAAPARSRMSREQRREQLLDTTLDLLAEDGFGRLSMEAIARRAGVNRAIVYRSFPNLQLLLLALLRREDARTRDTIDALLPDDPSEQTVPELLAGALATFLAAVLRSPQTYRLVLARPESTPRFLQKMVNRRRALVAERLRPLVEWGTRGLPGPASGLDADLLARLLLSAGEEMARLALDDPEFPPERLLTGTWTLLQMLPLRPATARRGNRRERK